MTTPTEAEPTTELAEVAEGRFRVVHRLAAALAVALVLIAALVYALIASTKANRAERAVQGSCQFFRDLTELPVTERSTEPLLRIVADARVAYTTADCQATRGKLGPVNPRVLPYLPNGMR